MRQLLVALATATAAIALAASPAAASPAPTPGAAKQGAQTGFGVQSTGRIWNFHTKNCIVPQANTNGAAVNQSTTCSVPHPDQNWYLSSTGDGYYYVVNSNTSKCLLARAADNKAVVWTCGFYGDQHWQLITDTTGYYSMIKNRTSGKCLVVRTADTQVTTYDCNSTYADQWWYRG